MASVVGAAHLGRGGPRKGAWRLFQECWEGNDPCDCGPVPFCLLFFPSRVILGSLRRPHLSSLASLGLSWWQVALARMDVCAWTVGTALLHKSDAIPTRAHVQSWGAERRQRRSPISHCGECGSRAQDEENGS